jgi:flagellar assembly protein FliH
MSNADDFVRELAPAAGTQAKPATTPQARFIPREKLGHFSSWQPLSIDGHAEGQRAPATPLQRATAHALAAAAGAGPSTYHSGNTPNTAPTGSTATPAATAAALAAARQTGYQDGYRDGVAALENFKQSYASQVTAQVGALLEAFDAQLLALDAPIAQALARTATQLARELLRSELQTRPERVAQVAADAVAAVLDSARRIQVYAHPQDLPLVADGAQEALAARGAQLLADPRLARGGVRVESDVGAVDASIGNRWKQAAVAMGCSEVPWVDLADAMDAVDAVDVVHANTCAT